MYSISKSHTGKGFCIYEVGRGKYAATLTPLAYIKPTKEFSEKKLEKLLGSIIKYTPHIKR